jgi:hypothetical protein
MVVVVSIPVLALSCGGAMGVSVTEGGVCGVGGGALAGCNTQQPWLLGHECEVTLLCGA